MSGRSEIVGKHVLFYQMGPSGAKICWVNFFWKFWDPRGVPYGALFGPIGPYFPLGANRVTYFCPPPVRPTRDLKIIAKVLIFM